MYLIIIAKLIYLIILILFIIFIIFNKNKNKYNFENELIRFIKINKKELKINNIEEKLAKAIKYVNFIKKSKHQISYKHVEKPKISFISTIFNQEKNLSDFIYSIQNQKLKEYELILVDDFSVDNGTKIIEKIKENDKRIKLIKNKKNFGTLYSRYLGELNANSKYIIFVDCDDFVLKDGIFNSYKYIEKNNIDIIQFHSIWHFKNKIYLKKFSYNYENALYQPYLSYIFYYNVESKKGSENNYALWNKLIKRKIVNKAFKWIEEKYLKEKIITHNDLIILFSFLKNANSFKYIDEIGYYYHFRSKKNSASNSWNNYIRANEIVHGLFTNIKFLYEKTGNTYLDKYFCIYKVQNYYHQYNKLFKYINDKEYSYITEIFNKLNESNYILKKDKLYIFMIKRLILKKMKIKKIKL